MTASVPPVQTQPREGVWIMVALGVLLAVVLGFAWHAQQDTDSTPSRSTTELDANDIRCVGALDAQRRGYLDEYVANGGDRVEDVCRPGASMSDPAAAVGR